jgi:cell division septation protein DedD
VLKIGEQEYPFTSNEENPKTYESYIERKGGDKGSNRLVEVGPIVKKLNLQRRLTAAVASKVKQRSDAAEKQLKSRK